MATADIEAKQGVVARTADGLRQGPTLDAQVCGVQVRRAAGARNPLALWVPSQNGLSADCPHRQIATELPVPRTRPSASSYVAGPETTQGPSSKSVISNGFMICPLLSASSTAVIELLFQLPLSSDLMPTMLPGYGPATPTGHSFLVQVSPVRTDRGVRANGGETSAGTRA